MKILFSAVGYPTKHHPFSAFIAMMAEEFAKKGHEVTVIAPQSVTRSILRRCPLLPLYEKVEVTGGIFPIKIYRPKSFTMGEGKIRGNFTFYFNRRAVEKCLDKIDEKYDVAYAHFWAAAYYVFRYTITNNIPLVVVSGEDKITMHKYITGTTLSELRNKIYKVIGVSSKNIKESISLGLATSKNSVIIPNGPDLRIFHPYNKREMRHKFKIEDDKFVIAFTGRFVYRKGAKRVEDAILSLKDEKIGAFFIGSAMKDEDAAQEPMGKEILYKGILDHTELPKWLSMADVFVLPTLAEGCSNAIVEAMGCGLPIISSDRDFNHDILNKENAFLVNPLDIEDIAAKIKVLKNNSQLVEEMGKASLEKAKEISFEKRSLKILMILEEAIKDRM